MKRRAVILVLGALLLTATPAQATTLAIGTAQALLRHSITETYAEDGIGIDERHFRCRRASRVKVNCDFLLIFPDGSYTCGRGFVWLHERGDYYQTQWYTRRYLCG